MENKPKILFWLNGFLLHFSLAYYLKNSLNADFFGILDINSQPKSFFENQTLVDFKKKWYFHDHVKIDKSNIDIDYLLNFEKKYHIDLWKLALNERFFYKFNRFYQFKKEEILSFLEQEIRLFEKILNDIKPDYFLTYDPVFHHQKLLLDICRSKGIKVLSVCSLGFENKFLLAESGSTFDLKSEKIIPIENQINLINNLNDDSRDISFRKFIDERDQGVNQKISALKDFLIIDDKDLINSNFMYFGRTKFKVIKDTLSLEIKRRKNFNFLEKNSTNSPDLTIPFIYFPMSIDEEMSLLHYAPYFTDQIEVITHIAKSIPIDHLLYVKEHTVAGLRGWHDPIYYKKILEIPNIVLINPNVDNEDLIKNSNLVITIRGTSPLKAMKNNKPSLIFGDQPFEIMSSVFKVDSLFDLPDLIKEALNHKVDHLDYNKYESIFKNRSFVFDFTSYEIKRNKTFFSGGILSNVEIKEKTMSIFLEKNKNMFSELINAHLTCLSNSNNIK
jgi:hypothetical protein